MTASTNVKYDFDPALPSPGEDYDKFEERLLNAGAAQTDDRGYSLADHFLGIDEGSVGGPALPIGAAGAKAQIKSRQRQKNAYGMLTKHVLDADHHSDGNEEQPFPERPHSIHVFASVVPTCRESAASPRDEQRL